jgi:soluble lytic murein transglycosylase-like protein
MKVFYNIPSTISTAGSSAGLYYSKRAEDFVPIIREICSRHGVDSDLVKAVIQVESNYQPFAVSPKGARGLMQLMPATASRYGVREIFDPADNVEGGVKYLKDLLQLFNRDVQLVLAAYNAGENAVQKYNGIPQYVETQNYVRKVLALYNGDPSYVPLGGSKPLSVTYFKYVDEKGVTHYSAYPISGVPTTKVSFYY